MRFDFKDLKFQSPKITFREREKEEAATGGVLQEKVFLETSQISRPATLLKKRLWRRYFPVNFVKISRAPFFIEHLW